MTVSRLNLLRRLCTAGRLLGVASLLCAAAIMLRAMGQPTVLSGWTATAVLGVIFAAFLSDRLLTSVMDRVDRFDRSVVPSGVTTDQPMREAA